MRKVFTLLIFICLLSPTLNAAEAILKGGFFKPFSKVYREVYGDTDSYLGLELRQNFGGFCRFFVQADFIHEKGQTTDIPFSTTIRQYPVSVGFVKYLCIAPFVNLYLGGGPTRTWVRIRNNSDAVANVHQKEAGFIGKGGLNFSIPKLKFSLDVFVEANLCNLTISEGSDAPRNHIQQIGGMKAGAGIGYCF